MAAYFPGTNIQADNMQTLYLMNPGYAGYTDAATTRNMALLNHSVGNALQTNNLASGQHSEHFIGIPLPIAPLSQHTSVGMMGNSPTAPQDVSLNLFASQIGGHPYSVWQNGGNELTFLQAADAAGSDQSLSGQLNNSGSLSCQSVVDISQLGVRRAPTSSIQEQQTGILQSGLSLQLEHSHGSTGHGQGLVLSLSPQQPSTVQLSSFQNHPTNSDINCPGSLSACSRDGMLGAGFSGPGFSSSLHGPGLVKQMQLDSSATGAAGLPNILIGSKYLKAAQQLLDEVVNVGKGIKLDTAKHQKSQSWIATMAKKENSGTEGGGKDGAATASTWPSTSAEEKNDCGPELSTAERQELQMKKAKLLAMLDEVDQRYRQYYHQMQIVVASFEAAAGHEAAKTYTALALQTISRHFRCLRDAVSGQIRSTSKKLGEEDSTGSGKGETSRLCFVDQQLRQQRALQQLGMIQQHAWRPQRGLPEPSVSVLRAWLFEHFLHPYPNDADKSMLARQTGLTISQVSNWFINARVRLWKPMVEEMYMGEIKDSMIEEMYMKDIKESDPELGSDEKMSKESGEKKNAAVSKVESVGNSGNGYDQKLGKSTKLDNNTRDADNDQKTIGALKSDNAPNWMNGKNQYFGIRGEGPMVRRGPSVAIILVVIGFSLLTYLYYILSMMSPHVNGK